MNGKLFRCSVVLGSLGACNLAYPAEEKLSLADVIRAGTVDMPTSTPPASFLLGASGENVPRLTSFRAFASQAARAYDSKGNVANAVGVEIAPALAMGRMTWTDVTTSQANRIWSRTMVSFATKAKSGDSPSQSAIGLQSILWAPAMDRVLQTMASEQCTGVASTVDTTLPGEPGSPKPALSEEQLKRIEACQKKIDAQLTKWNQPMLSVGAGRTFASSDGASGQDSKNSSAFWVTGAYGADVDTKVDEPDPITRRGYLLTAHFRQTTNVAARAVDGNDAFAKQKLVGLNARYGNAKLAGIGEYSILKSKASGSEFNDRKRAVLGLEYKIDKDLYLTLGVARDSGADPKKQSVLANLNWGFSKDPILLPK